jgi:hypothetical protein
MDLCQLVLRRDDPGVTDSLKGLMDVETAAWQPLTLQVLGQKRKRGDQTDNLSQDPDLPYTGGRGDETVNPSQNPDPTEESWYLERLGMAGPDLHEARASSSSIGSGDAQRISYPGVLSTLYDEDDSLRGLEAQSSPTSSYRSHQDVQPDDAVTEPVPHTDHAYNTDEFRGLPLVAKSVIEQLIPKTRDNTFRENVLELLNINTLLSRNSNTFS